MPEARTVAVAALLAPALICGALAALRLRAMTARERAVGARTVDAPKAIVSLQLAGSRERAARVLASWSPQALAAEEALLEEDRVLIRLYSAGFALAGMAAFVALRLSGLGLALADLGWLAIVATTAGLDRRENAGLAELLAAGGDAVRRGEHDATVRWTSRLARLKFVLLALQGLGVAAAAVAAWWFW